MNYSDWKRKALVLTVIYLFIGVAFAPGITASKEISGNIDLNSDLVEVTVEAGNRDHSVLLTPDQAIELENLIDLTKNRLDATYTMEETSKVFDEIVVSLYEMGMLPDGMSVRDVQRLVNGHNRYSRINTLVDGFYGKNLEMLDDEENRLCLIAGHTDNNWFRPTIFKNIRLIIYIFICIMDQSIYNTMTQLRKIFPLALCYSITYGYLFHVFMNRYWVPSSGWVHTNGLNGVKRWDGKFYGNISGDEEPPSHGFKPTGVRGFTGIKIKIGSNGGSDEYFYLGAARYIKMRYEKPGV